MKEEEEDFELYRESFERASADLEILRAAYPDEIILEGECRIQHEQNIDDDEHDQPTWFPLVFTLDLQQQHQQQHRQQHDKKTHATITMEFPKGYPTTKSLQVVSYRISSKKKIIEQVVASVKNAATEAMEEYGGEECGLACCAAAIECWTTLIESEEQLLLDRSKADMEEKLQLQMERINDDVDIHWITSEDTLIDRKSVFQAHLCIISSEEMVNRAVDKLIDGSTKIQRASHNMFAYRFSETLPDGKRILKHDNDDDGEGAAGSRLAQLLEMRNEDGVLILVSRWYGGVHLGPKRFAHITNVARDLLVKCHEDGTLPIQK